MDLCSLSVGVGSLPGSGVGYFVYSVEPFFDFISLYFFNESEGSAGGISLGVANTLKCTSDGPFSVLLFLLGGTT